MVRYQLYVDAAADLPVTERERYHIGVLPIPVTIDGQTYQSGVEITNEEFYRKMEECSGIPVTSQITPYAFEELFASELGKGTERLMLILINAKGSATYQNAVSTRDRYYAEYPEAAEKMKIDIFDGMGYSGYYGYVAILAAQKLELGTDIDQVCALIEEQLRKQCLYFGIYTLKYAGKSGRIPSAAVFVGEALGIRPIMKIWDHEITTADKARGEKKLIRELVKNIMSDMEPNTPYSMIYGNDEAARAELEEELTKKLGYPPVYSFQIGPAVAANSGPRLVGATFELRAKKRGDRKNKR